MGENFMGSMLAMVVYVVLFAYLLSAILYFLGSKTGKENILKLALILAIMGCVLHLPFW